MTSTRKKSSHQLTNRVACIILAGGQGTRLFPLTQSRCKPAVSFGGRYRLIDVPISNSLNSNMRNIFVIAQYFSSDLNSHVKETYPLDQFQGGNLHFLTPEERPNEKIWYEGTADAVRKNLDAFTALPIDYFLILSGDQLYNMDLEAMVAFAAQKNADLTIGALPVTATEAPRLGLLRANDQSLITDFREKPKNPDLLKPFELSQTFLSRHNISHSSPPYYLASMGIYIFRKEALIDLLREDTREDFGKHLIPTQIAKGKTAAFLHQGYWEDIGTISSYYEANLALTTNSLGLNLYNEILPIYTHNHHLPGARLKQLAIQDSIICDGAIIEAAEISHSVIGVRSVIKKGTMIHHSILLGNAHYTEDQSKSTKRSFQIGENCLIQKAIIDENVTIGNGVQLINQKKLTHYDGDGVFLRDGIFIITRGTNLPDHFTF
ncbi:MAG: sugar phosphate nucleotidyltransferase [Chlamydiota bacterium]